MATATDPPVEPSRATAGAPTPGTATVVTVAHAKAHLSRLIAVAEAGGEVVIARGSKPAVRLVPVVTKGKRRPGTLKGLIAWDERFWEPLPDDELRLWNGEGD